MICSRKRHWFGSQDPTCETLRWPRDEDARADDARDTSSHRPGVWDWRLVWVLAPDQLIHGFQDQTNSNDDRLQCHGRSLQTQRLPVAVCGLNIQCDHWFRTLLTRHSGKEIDDSWDADENVVVRQKDPQPSATELRVKSSLSSSPRNGAGQVTW